MTDLRITTISGTDAFLEEAAVQELRANLRGLLLRAGDQGYDEVRTVWNGMIDRRPALIARCAGLADVFINLPVLMRYWCRCAAVATTPRASLCARAA